MWQRQDWGAVGRGGLGCGWEGRIGWLCASRREEMALTLLLGKGVVL